MKLLLCVACSDVFSLRPDSKTCSCGACGGVYVDELNAEVWGKPGRYFVLGFANSTFVQALRDQLALGDREETMGGIYGNARRGRDFNAFIIPNSAPTVKRIHK